MDFIPLVCDNQRIAFLQATEPLCEDLKRLIWDKYLHTFEPQIPSAPQKIKYLRTTHETSLI